MISKLPLTVALLSITLLTAAFAVPATAPQDPAAQDSATQDPEETQLESYMDEINKGMRGLRKSLSDPARNAESLEVVRKLQLLAVQAKNEQPSLLADIPEAEQPAFLVAFAKAMCEMLHGLVQLEEALLDGDNDKARELRNEVNKLKKPGHREFKKPDEDEED